MTLAPQGFVGLTACVGLKQDATDFMLLASAEPGTTAAAVYTQSLFAGPSVLLNRSEDASRFRGVVTLSKNANVATGEQGLANAREVRERAAKLVGCAPEELLIASTGVIGVQYPMETLRAGMDALPAPGPADFEASATAIRTTDTISKFQVRQVGDAVIVGIAKGVGMIEPNMATMLSYFFTDAAVPAAELDAMFRRIVAKTYNAVSVDGDTSTSDTACVIANGLAGEVDLAEFEAAFFDAALALTKMIAADGEGATKLIEVDVTGARDESQARIIAKSIVNSPLVKTAVYGTDPNWGRVAMAIGKCEDQTDIKPGNVTIKFGDNELYPRAVNPERLDALREYLEGDEVVIAVDLGVAAGTFTAYGCDLTEEYIHINADYTT